MRCDELPHGLSRNVAHSLLSPAPDGLFSHRLFPLAVNLHIPFINSYLHNIFSCLCL